MGFNYGTERKRFDQEWAKLRKIYVLSGMAPEAIQSLYEFDLKFFRAQRTYASHIQSLPSEHISDDKTKNSVLFRKYVNGTTVFGEEDFSGRYSWVDTIENQQLLLALQKLNDEDLELLTFLVLEEHTQRELAQRWGCSQEAISKRFKRIKKFLATK